jgi:hypothetical protein
MRTTPRSARSTSIVLIRMLGPGRVTLRASTPVRAPPTLPQVPPFPGIGSCPGRASAALPRVPSFPGIGSCPGRASAALPRVPPFSGVGSRPARQAPATLPGAAVSRRRPPRQECTKRPVGPRHLRHPTPATLAIRTPPPSQIRTPPPSPSGPRHPHHPTLATQLARSCLRSEKNVPCSVAGDGSSVPVPSATRLTVVDQSA